MQLGEGRQHGAGYHLCSDTPESPAGSLALGRTGSNIGSPDVTSGGARLRSGPAPSRNSLRQDSVDWVHLPSARQGPAPAWPLARPTKRELVLWEQQWIRPQAVEWERLGQAELVASYVRCLVRAEGPHATAADWNVVVRLQGELGLTIESLSRKHWIIGEPEAPRPEATAPTVSARDRLRVVVGE